jgi:hypothetical protein
MPDATPQDWTLIETVGPYEARRRGGHVFSESGRRMLAHEYEIRRKDGALIAVIPMQHYKDARVKYLRAMKAVREIVRRQA